MAQLAIVQNEWILWLEKPLEYLKRDELKVAGVDYVGAPKILKHIALLKNDNEKDL